MVDNWTLRRYNPGMEVCAVALITLVEYAHRVGKAPNTCRKRAEIGSLNAVKMGRDWFIDENEVSKDARHERSKDNPIAIVRREHGVTQEQLAKRIGVHKNYLSMIERSERKPSKELLLRIAETLGIEVEDIHFTVIGE